MGRSEASIAKRKLKKRESSKQKRKILLEKGRQYDQQKNILENKLTIVNKKLNDLKSVMSSGAKAQFNGRKSDISISLSPSSVLLSDDVVIVGNRILGEGTFGVVKVGRFLPLNIDCAVKIGKLPRYFDYKFEARVLQSLAGCKYFPYVFGLLNDTVVMELIQDNDGLVRTVYSERKNDTYNQNTWIMICKQVSDAITYMHRRSLLHNDIKANNVLLKKDQKSGECPIVKVCDMGKVTFKTEPTIYKLSAKQKEKYNKKYSYLAHELQEAYNEHNFSEYVFWFLAS